MTQALNPNIIEDLNSNVLKVYPYMLPNTKKGKAFIKGNSVSLVNISQNGLDLDNLKQDENGNKYFEVFASFNGETILEYTNHTSVFGRELVESHRFIMTSNYFPIIEIDRIKIGNVQFEPLVFFIAEPFNKDKYESGEQTAFIANTIVEAEKGRLIDLGEITDPEGLYEFSLINIKVIENTFLNASVIFYEDKGAAWLTSDNKPGVEIEINSTALIGSIKGKGTIDGIFTDIDLKANKNLSPIKITPTSVQDKLTMYVDWFDYDYAMPMYIAKSFITGVKLSEMVNLVYDGAPFFEQAQINLISDMLAMSIAYAESFAQFPRITDPQNKDYGKLDPAITIGSKNLKLQALENKDPIKVIDGIYETYIRENPSDEDSPKFKAVKQVLASLSRYIYSSYAIGKGQNSFNNVYLPWFLQPSPNLVLRSTDKHYFIDPANTTFILKSKWFDIATTGITPKQNVNISNVKLVQTDRKLTIPELSDIITPIDKLPLPGDVNTKSSKDLMYFLYSPISDDDAKKLFLETPTVITDKSAIDVEVKSEWTEFGHLYSTLTTVQKQEKLIEAAIVQEHVSRDKVVFKSLNANLDKEYSNLKSVYDSYGHTTNFNSMVPGLNLNFSQMRGESDFTEEQSKIYIAWKLGVEKESISIEKVLRISTYQIGSSHVDNYRVRGDYRLLKERIVGVVTVSGSISNVNVNRTAIYDKTEWINLLRKLLTLPVNTTIKLVEENENTISNIDEITIASVWSDHFIIHFKGQVIKVPAFNRDDETIAIQRILFT